MQRDDMGFYDELSRLNNDLVNLQRQLAKNNAELRQSEKTLRMERDFAEALLNTARAAILVLDAEGRIVRFNGFMEGLSGYLPEKLRNKGWLDAIIAPDDREAALRLFNGTKKGAAASSAIFRIVTADSRAIDVEWHMSMLRDADGNPGGLLAIGLDITERKKSEELLRNNQKLESLGLLAGGIAHNFNNLMGGIFGYMEMAEEATGEEKVTRYLSKAMNTMDRAKELTAQLLTFAKGGAPILTTVPLFPFVRETALAALDGSNVSCRFAVAEGLWPCSIDTRQIGQVIVNLIINARQSMPSGGVIELKALNIPRGEKGHLAISEGNHVRISIKDTGTGIAKELLPRIYDPFFSTKPNGNGLGLTTSYSIVRQHGGAIDVESEPGEGSTFHVYLPAAIGASGNGSPAINGEGAGTIIVANDEESMREIIGDMIESLGYTAVCKNDGREALEYFVQETNARRIVTALLLDLTIPGGMGGKGVVSEIRKLNGEIPVFVSSGYADDPVMKNPAEYGFTASICKPFRKADLSKLLNNHLKVRK